MLSKRFSNDGKSPLELNNVSLEAREAVEDKIRRGIYTFEKVKCCICNGEDFQHLADKDRYGLFVSTVICKSCGLVQTNPRMTQESYNEFYNHEYRRLYHGLDSASEVIFEEGYHRAGPQIYNFLKKNLKSDLKNKFIVEIGSSSGGILKYFRDYGNKIFGLDLESESIEYGRTKHNLDLEIGTLERLQRLNQRPDIVIYCHVLEHILNPIQHLQELKKYIKPDTVIYIEVPGIKNLTWSYDEDFLLYLQNAHAYHFSLNTLKRTAALAGFRLVEGNEVIHSIFILDNSCLAHNFFENDYYSTMRFLRNLEILRLLPFTPYKCNKMGKRFKNLVRKLKCS